MAPQISANINTGGSLEDFNISPSDNCEEEVSRLRSELQAAQSQIDELKSDVRQQYELEEVNVIINLQDELRACKQVIHQQKSQVEQLILASEPQKPQTETQHQAEQEQENDNEWKQKFLNLQAKYSELENNRAWAEFQFRDRISNDSLKYHRRLIHWKSKNQQLEEELTQTKEQNENHIQQLQTKWKSTASSVLQHTLQDLKTSQGTVRQLQKEIARLKLKHQQPEISPVDSSSQFLVKAASESRFLN
jgi:hypothetical protein